MLASGIVQKAKPLAIYEDRGTWGQCRKEAIDCAAPQGIALIALVERCSVGV
jgi:hypothetical protein